MTCSSCLFFFNYDFFKTTRITNMLNKSTKIFTNFTKFLIQDPWLMGVYPKSPHVKSKQIQRNKAYQHVVCMYKGAPKNYQAFAIRPLIQGCIPKKSVCKLRADFEQISFQQSNEKLVHLNRKYNLSIIFATV